MGVVGRCRVEKWDSFNLYGGACCWGVGGLGYGAGGDGGGEGPSQVQPMPKKGSSWAVQLFLDPQHGMCLDAHQTEVLFGLPSAPLSPSSTLRSKENAGGC